jgi:flagella basal body P-ring formation protein FlgA
VKIVQSLLLILLATQVALSAASEAIYVRLKETAVVSDSVVKLGDLAELNSTSHDSLKKLENTVVAVAPLPGRSISISRMSLKKQLAGKYKSLILLGEDEITVRTRHATYPSDRYLTFAKNILSEKLADSYVDLDLKPVGVYKDLELPVGSVRFDVKNAAAIVLHKRTQVSVLVYVNNRFFALLPVWFEVNAKIVAYKALRNIDKFEKVDRAIVEPVLLDIAESKISPIAFQTKFSGFTATDMIKNGDVLTKLNVSNNHLVLKGQDVEVVSQSGPITLKFIATALQNGMKGDLIKIMNKKSKKSFIGKVVGAHSVRSI